MLLLGIDVGTSAVKVSVVDAHTRQTLVSVSCPADIERAIRAPQPGWAEQSPQQWWQDTCQAIQQAHASGRYNPHDIGAIGIAYQMHGLVLVDKQGAVLRDAIIWCDNRGVPYGERALQAIGPQRSWEHLLNSPGNFTAAKLAWVQAHEPAVYRQIKQVLLPGDYLALQFTGEATTSVAALSEGIFWDFVRHELSRDVFQHFDFDPALIPPIRPVFSEHGRLAAAVAAQLSLPPGIPVSYKAGDQPNNALALNVLQPGEVAATAGTSGVVYAVTDQLMTDPSGRVNTFAHVNHSAGARRLGVLLCINGTGSMNRWTKNAAAAGLSYPEANKLAATVPLGSAGLRCLPFGNGAERMLGNRQVGAHFLHLDVNRHTPAHLLRATQEGVAFAFRYGLDVMRANNLRLTVVKAGRANMFLSPLFAQSFADATGLAVELYPSEGSVGAALGAGIGVGVYGTPAEAFSSESIPHTIYPSQDAPFVEEQYARWKSELDARLQPELLLAQPNHQQLTTI